VQPQAGGTYRFGVFELDRVAMELRKRGVMIKLQDQPFRILCALLDAHGEIVSREAMKAVLWPEDTFVEFERSMNAAVAKLRQALGDSAENPRFIETLPRRGYRFIVSVVAPEAALPEPVVLPVIAPQPVGRTRLLIPLLVLTFAGVLGGTAFWFWPGRARLEPPLEAAPLTTYPGFESNPSISPDGNQVAFSWYRDKDEF
jgi:DNA-binding winged helix-turn-helix (wHTH) protein